MAANSYGTRGNPVFSDSGAPDTAVDPSLAAQYGSIVGNRIVGSSTQRAAFSAIWAGFTGGPWDGLEFHETDTLLTYLRVSGAWVRKFEDGAWTTLPLSNSWVAFGGAYQGPRYRRLNNEVVVEGLVKSGTITAGSTIGTLPAGFRPAAQLVFSGVSNFAAASVEVKTDGTIITGTVGSNTFLSLSGIRFAV